MSVAAEEYGSPSILEAALRYKWLVIGIVLASAVLAASVVQSLPNESVARASILLEDVSATDVLSGQGLTSQDRFVRNQLGVLRSGTVARRATEIASEEGFDLSVAELIEAVDAIAVSDTDVITVSYGGSSEREATTVLSAMIEAFQQVLLEQRFEQTASILERLDAAGATLENDLASVQSLIDQTLVRRSIDASIELVLDQLIAVEQDLAATSSAAAREDLLVRLNELNSRLQTLRLAEEVETQSRSIRSLAAERDEVERRLSVLNARRSEVQIESEAEGTGVAFVDAAQITSTSQGAGSLFTALAGAFLGLLIALGVVNYLANRRGSFLSRKAPEALGLRLLADIPEIRGSTALPVRDAPRSPDAEAFRFASSNIGFALDNANAQRVTFVSASVGDGKSTLLANTAIAAAKAGKRVLVVDADFGNQTLSTLLLGRMAVDAGLTEVAANRISLDKAVKRVDNSGSSTLDLLTRGAMPVVAPDFFEQDSLRDVFDLLSNQYDMVFIDSPPFLQVAYAGAVARLAGHLVLVIPHDSSTARTSDLIDRASFLGVEILGYLYNRAPLSEDLAASGGSMKDVLGDHGWSDALKSRSNR